MAHPIESQSSSVWRGEIPIQSFYTAGAGGQVFFQALKEFGKLIGTRCQNCDQVYVPARLFCERCFAKLTDQIEVSRKGRLGSYTICYFDRDRRPLNPPLVLALVQLEGATTLMLHYLLDVKEPEKIKIGSNVEAIVKPSANRVGSMLDIEGFRIIPDSAVERKP
jgi:uncharacterized OB-fold protein